MLDLGWQEFFLIATIAVVVVGPKDLPKVIRTIVGWVRKVRSMARDFQGSIEEVAREAELDEIRREAAKLAGTDLKQTILDSVDPDRELSNSLKEAKATIEADAGLSENTMLDPNAGPSPSVQAGSQTAGTVEPTLIEEDTVKGWDAASVSTPASSVTPPPSGVKAAEKSSETSGTQPAQEPAQEPVKKAARKTGQKPAAQKPARKAAAKKPAARKSATAKTAQAAKPRKPRAAAKPKTTAAQSPAPSSTSTGASETQGAETPTTEA